jgi:hypothetical protein
MKTTMSKAGGIRMAAALIGAACVSTASAQQQPLDTQSLPASRVQAASCAEVAWEKDLLALYPRIAEGCQEVVVSDDVKWARFEADYIQRNRDGSVTLDFKNRQGRSLEELTLTFAAEQRVLIDGRPYPFSDLTRGQRVSLYVPEGTFAVAVEPGAPPEQLAQIVRDPIRVAQADPAPQLAQADRTPAQVEPRLPSTAGPLPLLLLAGLVSALVGLGLTVRRRFKAKVVVS